MKFYQFIPLPQIEKILNEIKYLELPYEWKPQEVIDYIVRKISKE